MARIILIIGEAGSGKSSSLETVDEGKTFLIKAVPKDLPFVGGSRKFQPYNKDTGTGNMIVSSRVETIEKILEVIPDRHPQFVDIVLDDFQYTMGFEFMDRAKEKGYEKFTEIGQNAYRIFRAAEKSKAENVIIMAHSETIWSEGSRFTKIKTIGKMVDEKITLEGLTTYVFLAKIEVEDNEVKHYFLTHSDGSNTARSPKGMFDYKIPNDLNAVLEVIKKENPKY